MKKYEKILVGIERELYVGSYVDEKSQFSYPCENERIVLIFSNGTHLTIWEEQDICPSGYTTCTYGRWKRGKGKRPFSYRMKGGPMQVTIEEGKDIVVRESQTNEVIACTDYDGGDEYYPQGEIYLDFELFTETARRMEGRPVWIFSGTSALGKSTLGALLAESGKVVYETDSAETLPEEIWADVVVAGQRKGGFSIEEIKQHLPDGVKPILVGFSEA